MALAWIGRGEAGDSRKIENRKQQLLSGLPGLLWSSCKFPVTLLGAVAASSCVMNDPCSSQTLCITILLFCYKNEENEAGESWVAQGYGSLTADDEPRSPSRRVAACADPPSLGLLLTCKCCLQK